MKKVSGLDVHKDSIFMCIIDENNQVILEEFSTLTPDIERMRDLLKEQKVSEVANGHRHKLATVFSFLECI